MPTSKFPVNLVDVPKNIVEFAATHPGVRCNTRPEQCFVTNFWGAKIPYYADRATSIAINDFLRRLVGKKVAIHAQGFGEETATLVAPVEYIYWGNELGSDFPRIDLAPREIEFLKRFPINLWGSFVLAISEVKETTKDEAWADVTGQHFLDVVTEHGVQS